MENLNKYAEHYSDNSFIEKIKKFSKKIPFSREVVAMFYCMKDEKTPGWVKGMIAGALGYFILPLDAIPDIAPVIGWLDDAGVIAACLFIINCYIKEEHYRKADEFFGINKIFNLDRCE